MALAVGDPVDGECRTCGAEALVCRGFGEVECQECEVPDMHPELRGGE